MNVETLPMDGDEMQEDSETNPQAPVGSQDDWVQTTRQGKGDDVFDLGARESSVDVRNDVNARLHSGEQHDGETFTSETTQGETRSDSRANLPADGEVTENDGPDLSNVPLDQGSTALDHVNTDSSFSDEGVGFGAASSASGHANKLPETARPFTHDVNTGSETPFDDASATAANTRTPVQSDASNGVGSSAIETEASSNRGDDNISVQREDQGGGPTTGEPPEDIELVLAPTRADMPYDTAQPGETVTLNVRLGGEAYRGDPAYEILVDGEVVAGGVVDWAQETTTQGRYGSHEDVDWRDVTVDLQVPVGGFGNVEVRFPNDAYKRDVGDRNLLVDKITIDDVVYEAEADETIYHGGHFADGASQERMPWRGTLEFDVSDMADHANQLPAPEGAYVIENQEGASVGTLDLSEAQLENTSLTVSDDRFEIIGNEIKLKDGVSLDYEQVQNVSLEVTATRGDISSTEVFDVAVADVPEPVYTVVEGPAEGAFTARYFDVDHRIRELSDIDWNAAPTHEESVSAIDYENGRGSFWEGGSRDTFGVQINGQIDVPESGTFSFTLGGDDGAMLFIDGQPIIDNDGLHSFKSETVDIQLEPGPHAIEVIYFENFGHAGLKLEWDGPGIDGPALVAPMGMEDAQSFEGVALGVNVELPRADELVSIRMEGLPAGFILTEGDNVAVSDSDPVSLDGWDLSNIQITPPVGFTGDVTAVVEGSDGGLLQSVSTVSFEVVDSGSAYMTPMLETGFRVEFFEEDHRLRRLEDVDFDAPPVESGIFGTIDFANSRDSFWEGGAKDQFAARVTGEIEIGEGGVYDFRIASDDGAKLFINGEEVVENDGLHGFRNRDGEVELEAGVHEVEVLYFENHGRAGLRFEYSGPDTDGEMSLVPALPSPSSDGSQPAELALNLDGFSEVDAVTFSGLPDGTWLSDGESSTLASDGSADVTDWDVGLLQIVPPHGATDDFVAEINVDGVSFNGASITQKVSTPIEVNPPRGTQDAVDQSLWDVCEGPEAGGSNANTGDENCHFDHFSENQNDDEGASNFAIDG